MQKIKEKLQANFLFKPCQIKPLENYQGVITSLCINSKGVEYQVRYYYNGEQKTEWFYDFEIEVLNTDK